MPMSTSRNTAATLALLARLSVPFLAASGGAMVQGCIFGSPGPSNVAVGKLYVSGESQYDQFFSELYQVQLPMGQATDREANNRARVANLLGIPPDSRAEQIADAVDQRAIAFGKAGLTLKVQASGLDAGGTPSAELLVSGTPPKPADQGLVTALAQSLKDDAGLIADLRRDRPRIEQLKPMADALEPGIDVTFRKGGAPKKSEVRKNVQDAQRLVPLMAQRSGELEHRAAEFIQRIQKVLGAAPSTVAPPAPTPPPVEPAAPATPKKAGAKATGAKAAPGASRGDAAPPKPKAARPEPPESEEPKEPKAAKPKAAKPAADDFEP
jgi:hypothetical protein